VREFVEAPEEIDGFEILAAAKNVRHPLAGLVSSSADDWGAGVQFVTGKGPISESVHEQAERVHDSVHDRLVAASPDETATDALRAGLASQPDLDPLVRDELIGGVLTAAEHATMLISSHDLSEIESFISHVGYLDQGRLRFSEEMGTLANRFREIEIITHDQGKLPQNLPGTWMNVERSDNWVRWVDTQFDRERSMTEIIRLFGDTRHVEAKPMPLRAIFVTLAKASQSEA
jgi:hypothetical protein